MSPFDHGKYYREKYWYDPIYRKNRIAWSKAWAKKNLKRIRIAQKRRYDNRTPTQIAKRKRYLRGKRYSKELNYKQTPEQVNKYPNEQINKYPIAQSIRIDGDTT